MANEKHLSLINQGVDAWNRWRQKHHRTQPDLRKANIINTNLFEANLREADLREANLREANLTGANLGGANLSEANLSRANLSGVNISGVDLREADLSRAILRKVNLSGADLREANLFGADLREANLGGAYLCEAYLSRANLSGANLSGANLMGANLVEANLENANLDECRVYGISAWSLKVNQETKQSNLIITQPGEATVTVSDLEVAQFIYLLLNREKLRNVLTTMTTKSVLLLGRFTPERKAVLDALADELRKHNLLPIIFDFERSTTRDFTETIRILAGLSLFVIVDITKPKSAPQELAAVVPDYQIPFVPILEEGEDPYSMFGDFGKYDWVLPLLKYRTTDVLLTDFGKLILERAMKKHVALQRKKNKKRKVISI